MNIMCWVRPLSVVRFPILISLVVLLAAGCVQQTPTPEVTPAPTPLPPIGLVRTDNSSVVASARIIPAQSANLALTVSGRVAERPVEVGDLAPAGALLLRLDDTAAQIALTQARAAHFRAQAQLAEAQAAPQPSALDGAQAQLDAAQARLSQLADPARPSQITAGQADLTAAQAAYQALFDGPDESARINALAALSNARAALQQAQSAYNEVSWRNDIGALPQSRQLQEASANLEAAQARYDALFAEPTADAISAARARVEQARSALDRLQAPATEAQLAEAEAQVRAAQAQFDALTEGMRSETLSVVASTVAETRALLQRAEQDLANLELRAPFTGTVTAVNVAEGEFVGAGVPVVTLADLDRLQAETFDLSERDVAFVQVGQAANVLIEPLLVTVLGRVVRVAPQANIIGGDVVYTVLVDLDEQPVGLRWGMNAEVTIE